jgi:DNA-binding PadR family transcriptional regulator
MVRKSKDEERTEILQGTLDMLILRTLLFGPLHGHAVAHSIEQTTEDVLKIDHGSLYPALHRRKQLVAEASKWERMVEAVGRVMQSAPEEG